MTPRTVERLLWSTAIILAVAALLGWHDALARVRPLAAPPVIWGIEHAPEPPAAHALDSAARAITTFDPFRLDRRPAGIAYGAEMEGVPVAPPPPKPPKPVLSVAGIVGGPPWVALLDGVPGRSGSVLVHAGDTLAGLRVRSLGPTTAIITGLDTTWKLTLKRPWQ